MTQNCLCLTFDMVLVSTKMMKLLDGGGWVQAELAAARKEAYGERMRLRALHGGSTYSSGGDTTPPPSSAAAGDAPGSVEDAPRHEAPVETPAARRARENAAREVRACVMCCCCFVSWHTHPPLSGGAASSAHRGARGATGAPLTRELHPLPAARTRVGAQALQEKMRASGAAAAVAVPAVSEREEVASTEASVPLAELYAKRKAAAAAAAGRPKPAGSADRRVGPAAAGPPVASEAALEEPARVVTEALGDLGADADDGGGDDGGGGGSSGGGGGAEFKPLPASAAVPGEGRAGAVCVFIFCD